MNDHSISSTINPAVAVREAGEELLDGILRNNRGTKLQCHLLDTALILGRPSTRGAGGARKRLQVGFTSGFCGCLKRGIHIRSY